MKNYILLACILLATTAFGQKFSKGNLQLANGTTIEGRVALDNTLKKVTVKDNNGSKSYNFNNVNTVRIDDKQYTSLTINNKKFIAHALTPEGSKATLYALGGNNYVIQNGSKHKAINTSDENQRYIPGILSVLFDDCNTIREQLRRENRFRESALIDFTNTYNNCNYQAYSPTEKEVAYASQNRTDEFSFYAGAGLGINSIQANSSDTESAISPMVAIGVMASPSFLGTLQGNLFASLEAQANFEGTTNFQSEADAISFNRNSVRLILGLDYVFNKNGKIKPFVGIGAGITADYFDGNFNQFDFKIDGGNPITVPKIGALFALQNDKKIGVTVSYITTYDNELTFPTQDEIIELDVESQLITVGLKYHF